VNGKECDLSVGEWQSECCISENGKAADRFQAVVTQGLIGGEEQFYMSDEERTVKVKAPPWGRF
jgi:hypothetical protein